MEVSKDDNDDNERILILTMEMCKEILSQDKSTAKIMGESEIFSLCMKSLNYRENPYLQRDAMYVLAETVLHSSQISYELMYSNSIPILIDFIESPVISIVELTVLTIGRLINQIPLVYNALLDYKIIHLFLNYIDSYPSSRLHHNIIWTLSSMTHYYLPISITIVEIIIEIANKSLYADEISIIRNACRTLVHLTNNDIDAIDIVVKSGMIPKLVDMMENENAAILRLVLRIVGNIVRSGDLYTEIMIAAGGLGNMKNLLKHPQKKIVKLALWICGNILCCEGNALQLLISTEVLPMIFESLPKAGEKLQQSAAVAFQNFTDRINDEQQAQLIQFGVVKPFCNLLNSESSKTVSAVLSGMINLLQTNEIVGETEIRDVVCTMMKLNSFGKLNELQFDEDEDICHKSTKIVESIHRECESEFDDMTQSTLIEIIPHLLTIIDADTKMSFARDVVLSFRHLCLDTELRLSLETIKSILPHIKRLLSTQSDTEILVNICQGLSFLTENNEKIIEAVVNFEVLPILSELLETSDDELLEPALRIVRNVITMFPMIYNDYNFDTPLSLEIQKTIMLRLIKLLSHSDREIQIEACQSLIFLSGGNNERMKIVLESDEIPKMVNLLKTDDVRIIEPALCALGNIVISFYSLYHLDNRSLPLDFVKLMLPSLNKLLAHSDRNICAKALRAFSHLADGDDASIQAIVDSGSLTELVNFLQVNENGVLELVLYALANITASYVNAASDSKSSLPLANVETITQNMNELLSHKEKKFVLYACQILSYLSDMGEKEMKVILESGIAPKLISLLETDDTEILEPVLCAVGNIIVSNTKDPIVSITIVKLVLPYLKELLSHSDKEILADTCRVYSYLCYQNCKEITMVVESGAVPKLISLLTQDDIEVVQPVMDTIENILKHDHSQMNVIIESNGLQYLSVLMKHSSESVAKQAAWITSFIMCGETNLIQHAINIGILSLLINFLQNLKYDEKLHYEAVVAFEKFIKYAPAKQLSLLLTSDVLKPLCCSLDSQDMGTVDVVLNILSSILETAKSTNMDTVEGITKVMILEIGGKVKALQNHKVESIRIKSTKMIDSFFRESCFNLST